MRKHNKLVFCVLFLAMVMLISGCMKMHYDIVWNSDNSGTLVITYGMEKSAMADSGQSEDDVRSQMKEDFEGDKDVKIVDYSDDEYTGIIVTMEIDDLTKTTNEVLETLKFNYSEEGGTKSYTVSGNFSDEPSGDMGTQLGSIDVKLSIVMPGNITSHNATEQAGNKLIWDIASGSSKIEASSEISTGGGIINILMWVLFVLGILILAASVLLIIVKMQRK